MMEVKNSTITTPIPKNGKTLQGYPVTYQLSNVCVNRSPSKASQGALCRLDLKPSTLAKIEVLIK